MISGVVFNSYIYALSQKESTATSMILTGSLQTFLYSKQPNMLASWFQS